MTHNSASHGEAQASFTGRRIAYNLIRDLMLQAAALYCAPIDRLSFKSSVDTLRQWTDTLNAAHDKPREQARLFNQLLQILAEDTVPLRAARPQTPPKSLPSDDPSAPRLSPCRRVQKGA